VWRRTSLSPSAIYVEGVSNLHWGLTRLSPFIWRVLIRTDPQSPRGCALCRGSRCGSAASDSNSPRCRWLFGRVVNAVAAELPNRSLFLRLCRKVDDFSCASRREKQKSPPRPLQPDNILINRRRIGTLRRPSVVSADGRSRLTCRSRIAR